MRSVRSLGKRLSERIDDSYIVCFSELVWMFLSAFVEEFWCEMREKWGRRLR
jgi:hypothetical protein